MRLRRLLRLTNRRARVLVGLLLAALFCIQCTSSEAVRESTHVKVIAGVTVGENPPEMVEKARKLAKTDHIALLEYCLENYDAAYSDYTCTLIKTERIAGALGKQQRIAVKFMESPYSVAMKWLENPPRADRILYIEGKYDNQMLVRPTNLFFRSIVGGSVLKQPDGPEAMSSTLRPVSKFGFKRATQSLLGVYRKAREAGDLREEFGGFANVAGREAVVLVRYLPPENDYPAHRALVYVDLEYLVPIGIESYDWDGRLLSRYIYSDVKFNVALTGEDFLPKANDLAAPG